jgi:hypothetical protein
VRSERRLARRPSSRFRAAILAPRLGRHFSSFVPYSQNYGGQAGRGSEPT